MPIHLPTWHAYDEWCGLQDPVVHPAEGECAYGLGTDPVGSVTCAPMGPCIYSSGEVFDGNWIDLVLSRPCFCDPDSCLANVDKEYGAIAIDARLNDAGDQIEGTLSTDRDAHLVLTLE